MADDTRLPGGGEADPSAQDRPGRAIGLYLLAMIAFVSMDGLSKQLTTTGMAPEQVTSMRYAIVLLLLAPIVAWRWRSRPMATTRPGLQTLRGVLLIASATLFVYALRALPIEQATAIGFVSPMFVTLLSIVFLGEKVGVRRWAAIALGFAGVLAILRPGAASFELAMLLPICSSFCWACGLIITRAMRGRERPFTIVLWSTATGLLVVAPFSLTNWRPPTPEEIGLLVLIALCHLAGQLLTIRAFMTASASLLAPFSYSTIIWATLIGYFAFASLPDLATTIGAAILAAAGLYVWHRERVLQRRPTPPGASIAASVPPSPGEKP